MAKKTTTPKETIHGTSNKVLSVNLTDQSHYMITIKPEDREKYLGGKGLGLKLLFDMMHLDVDPLGAENYIAFMMGVLMGTNAPCSGRFDAITKSPLTGLMTSSSCGGPFGMALKTSGFDGLLITGKSKKPVYLTINSKGVSFHSARTLWGKTISEAQEIIKNKGNGSLVIGPAGENLVRFANIASGHRYLGRGGLGAVLGSKNCKAIVAFGDEYKIKPIKENLFNKYRKKALTFINKNIITSDSYRMYGTAANVMLNNKGGILPVRNFTEGKHGDAHLVSGESFKEKYNTKFNTCKPCSILCGHKGFIDKKEIKIPEYETIGLFGPNLQVFNKEAIIEWNDLCSDLGMDTISTAGVIAWAMEATEKKLIKSKLLFGKTEGVSTVIKNIAQQKGLGKDLAQGVRSCSDKYGGKDFAMHVKGLEFPGYDPRGSVGQGLSYAVANRGACHLASSMFAIEVFFNLMDPVKTAGKPYIVSFNENVYSAVNSLHICQFTAFAFELEAFVVKYTPNFLLKIFMTRVPFLAVKFINLAYWAKLWQGVTGVTCNGRKFLNAGERIQVLERYMNTLIGVSRKDDTLPGRMLVEFRKADYTKQTVPLDGMLDEYYKIRGYDVNGIPKLKTLKKFGINPKSP